MGHYAKVEAGVVTKVIVAKSDHIELLPELGDGGQWIKTSYNTRGGVYYDPETGEPAADQSQAIRYNYASVGCNYIEEADAFTTVKQDDSWVLDTTTYWWVPSEPVEEEPTLVFYSDALDYSGSGKVWTTRLGNDGNLNGNPAFTAGAPTYFSLDGSGDYNQTPYDPATRTTTISIEQWLAAPDWEAGSAKSYKTALSCAEYGGYRNSIDGRDFISIVYVNGDYLVARARASGFGNNTWHHFVTTYDGQYLKLYVDGVLKRRVNAGGKYPITYSKANSLLMGAEASSGSGSDGKYWNGKIALTRIYNDAWSEAGVAKLYEESKGRFGI